MYNRERYKCWYKKNREKHIKKVREYYDSLQIYYETKVTHPEVYVPIITAEPITITQDVSVITNPFQNYQYTQDIAEPAEEKYESQNSDVKIIKLG